MFAREPCVDFEPEYEKAAEALAKYEPKRTLAYVDAKQNLIVSDRMSVRGFPSVFFFK